MTDLRIIKTRKNIREAFFELRSKNALEKIKVTDLCALALINKTTFYKHYRDIYTLSEEIENELILSIMNGFDKFDSLFSDPNGFILGLKNAFKIHEQTMLILFSGRMDVLINKVESRLITYYPSFKGIPEREIMLSFLLKGASHVLMESKYDEAILLDTLSKIVKQAIMLFDDHHRSNPQIV